MKMLSQQQGSQMLRRNGSPALAAKTPGPLRATLPISFMSAGIGTETKQAVPLKATMRNSKINNSASPITLKNSNGPRSRQSPFRIRQWSPTLKVESGGESTDGTMATVAAEPSRPATIRRTASLDAIYLTGKWPRGRHHRLGPELLLVDKATQTPDEWSPSQQDERHFHLFRVGAEWKQKQQRTHGGFEKALQLNLPTHQYSGPVSPNRTASTNTECQQQPNSPLLPLSSAIAIAPRPQPVPRVRNSVEGVSTELEKVVWRRTEISSAKLNEPTPDGHRAPIAELFKTSPTSGHQRSVNTQTPVFPAAASGSTNSSSGNSSPLGSVSPLVWPPSRPASGAGYTSVAADELTMRSLSPEVFVDFQTLGLGPSSSASPSPKVSRFLGREPPDGCEKVPLKTAEQPAKTGQDYGPPKPGPNAQFVLQPSSGSAFCLLPPYNKPAVLWPAARSPSPLSLEAPAGSDMQ